MEERKFTRPVIFHLLTTLETGGAERALAKTLPYLKDFQHIVCAVKPLPQNDKLILNELKRSSVQIHTLEMKNIVREFSKGIAKLKLLLHNSQPACLITYLTHADIVGRFAARKTNMPIICFLRSTLREFKYLPLTLINGLTAGYITHYFTVSHTAALPYQHWFDIPTHSFTVIPNGINVKLNDNRILLRKKIRDQLNLSEAKIVFGYVAKMRPQKGFETLLRAFATIVKKYPQSQLLLIGDGPKRLKYERLTKKLNLKQYVRFLGLRSDIPNILAAIDIFVFPSLYEGMSNALLEAMAAGCPIVATDIPENREVLGNPPAAILVKPKQSYLLVEAMEKLIREPFLRQQYANAAYRRAVTVYPLKHCAEQFQKTLWQILNHQTPVIPSLNKRLLNSFKEYPYFIIIGSLGVLINLGITTFFTEIIKLFYLFSYVIGTFVNWTLVFFLNAKITFSSHSKEKQFSRYLTFLIVYSIIFVLNISTVYLLTSIFGLYYLFSIIATTGIYSIFTFLILQKKIFI